MRRSAVPWRRGQRDKRPDQPVGTASAASFWWHGPDQELAAEAAPAGFAGAEAAAAAVAVAVAVDLRGPSGAAGSSGRPPEGRGAWLRGVFRADTMSARKIPRAPRSRRESS